MARLIAVSKSFNEKRESGAPVQNVHCVILRADYMID